MFILSSILWLMLVIWNQASVCAAGDSAAYQRSQVFGDDVVIVA